MKQNTNKARRHIRRAQELLQFGNQGFGGWEDLDDDVKEMIAGQSGKSSGLLAATDKNTLEALRTVNKERKAEEEAFKKGPEELINLYKNDPTRNVPQHTLLVNCPGVVVLEIMEDDKAGDGRIVLLVRKGRIRKFDREALGFESFEMVIYGEVLYADKLPFVLKDLQKGDHMMITNHLRDENKCFRRLFRLMPRIGWTRGGTIVKNVESSLEMKMHDETVISNVYRAFSHQYAGELEHLQETLIKNNRTLPST